MQSHSRSSRSLLLSTATALALAGLGAAAACSSTPDGAASSAAEDGGAVQGAAPLFDGATPVVTADGGTPAEPTPGKDAGAPDSGKGKGDASSPSPTDAGATSANDAALPGWTLTWSDEFNGPNGSAADPTYWTQETGNSGWTNNQEREYYTSGTDNAEVEDGSLVITAKSAGASAYTCQYGACEYTSARLNTSGKFTQAYGRFEARAQLPSGSGLWPAFWTLGDNIGSVSWPQCGEIDIMENIGKTPSTNYGSMHGPGYSGAHPLTGSYTMPDGGKLSDGFHVYAIEWAVGTVSFYFDDVLYETKTTADVPAGDTWVYDHPFFIILNVAVGGSFPGQPDGTAVFPQTMKVNYVRVYSKN